MKEQKDKQEDEKEKICTSMPNGLIILLKPVLKLCQNIKIMLLVDTSALASKVIF